MPSISVIIPVYQVEAFLHRCVNSILSQTFRDFDLILVDDGSPDNCGDICDAYARQDFRVHVIHQNNGGLSAARNAGIDWAFANSDSQWLAFVDSDDWVHPEYLQQLYHGVQCCGTKISACGFFRTEGEPFPEEKGEEPVCMTADDYYCGTEHEGLTAVAWNKLYHKSLFADLRYPIGKLHEDEFTTYKAVYQAETISVISARLYAYYQNPEGIMRSKWSPRRMHVLEAFEQQIAFAQETGRQRLLKKVAEQYIYTLYVQLENAQKVFWKELRRKLRRALKLGRECGAFPKNKANSWAYEAAYPCKPYWWVLSKLQKMEK